MSGLNNNNDNSNHDNDNTDEDPPMPTFSGNVMPMNVALDMDDDIGEETTRRIGGATFNPTFEPVSFEPSQMAPSFATMNTTLTKVSISAPPTSTRGLWKLKEAPVLPEFHPLDRHSAFVPHASASLVANRVAEVLRDRSIEAHFDNVKAKVRCLTTYNVDFRVFLYRGQEHYSHGIIVEVQRRSGASNLFSPDTRAILEGAQGKASSPPLLTSAEIPMVSDTEDDYDDSSASLASLDFCAKMLNHDAYGPNLLGMQTLSSLTDPAKMGMSTSMKVSQALVEPNNEVGAKVFSIIVDKKTTEEEEGLRTLAMSVLANVVHAVNGNISSMMREALRPVLLQEIRNAPRTPQMAYLAAKCLEPLIQEDHNASDFYSVLDKAQNVGEARHAGLRDEAEKCIHQIDSRF